MAPRKAEGFTLKAVLWDVIHEGTALQMCPESQQPCAAEISGLNLMAQSSSGAEKQLSPFLCLNHHTAPAWASNTQRH